jgi:hypothetical protein
MGIQDIKGTGALLEGRKVAGLKDLVVFDSMKV